MTKRDLLSGAAVLPAHAQLFKATIRDAAGNVVSESHTSAVAAHRIMDVLDGVPERQKRDALREAMFNLRTNRPQPARDEAEARVLRDRMRDLRRESAGVEQQIVPLEAELSALQRYRQAYDELAAWVRGGLRLEKPRGSRLHHLADAWRANEVMIRPTLIDAACPLSVHAFVIEHDWAAVMAPSEEMTNAEFQLPFPDCCFEFRMSGKHVCLLILTHEENAAAALRAAPFVETSFGWMLSQYVYRHRAGTWRPGAAGTIGADEFSGLFEKAMDQVRAVCICLEAEVAEKEVVRAPHRLNHSRAKAGRIPLFDYHVVRVNRDPRPVPRELEDEREKRTSPRLHFRRKHWRHYQNHKVEIPWTLVGDPDLGFIDKHYRL